MTARSEIEHRQLYYKRRSSCTGIYREREKARRATSATLDGETCSMGSVEEDYIRSRHIGRRIKSTSVCIGALQMEGERRLPYPPRTLNDFQFLNPEVLTIQNYELQTIRPPALSTSEVFNAPPPMYIYRAVAPKNGTTVSKRHQTKIMTYIRRKKHTIVAFVFGIVAVTICTVVVVLQSRSDFR